MTATMSTSPALSSKSAAEEELAVRPTMLERRPLRPFKSSEEYLYAMKEDLADWLSTLYELDVGVDTFLEALETGVVLCRHANNVRRMALEFAGRATYPVPDREVTYRADVAPGTFQARDNVSNFIWWCRALGIYECLLFETDDLVLRKNEKSFILCLLEVARRGSKVGMLAPLLVQMEEEIDREIAAEEDARIRGEAATMTSTQDQQTMTAAMPEEDVVEWQPPVQIITNDLKNLDEMVRDLVNRCTCPLQFPMIRVSEGKYRIGDTKLLIYVRILRSHVMVRVGGGWDTLAHFLDKHDPCRCRQGHRAPLSSKLTVKFGGPAQTQMEVTYQRSAVATSPSSHCSPFVPSAPRQRSISPMAMIGMPPSPTRQRRNSTSSSSSSSHKLSNGSLASLPGDRTSASAPAAAAAAAAPPSDASTGATGAAGAPSGGTIAALTCDSSSEYSDDGYKSGSRIPTVMAIRKYSPKKQLVKLTENGSGAGPDGSTTSDENADSCSPRDSLLGEDDDDVISSSSPVLLETASDAAVGLIVTAEAENSAKFNKNKSQVKGAGASGSTSGSNRARRLSGDAMTVASAVPARRMPRSRSQSSEVSDGSSASAASGFARNQTGRYSYRSPQLHLAGEQHKGSCCRSHHNNRSPANSTTVTSPDKNNTWSFRSRSSRPSLATDLFHGQDDSRSPSTSPQRRPGSLQRGCGGAGPRSLQTSPSKHYAPLLQQMLADVALDSDDKVLRRMATILRQRKMSAPSGCPSSMPHLAPSSVVVVDHPHQHNNNRPASDPTPTSTTSDHLLCPPPPHPATNSPDSGSEFGALEPVARLLKVSPRKDNYPRSGSKIPVPTFY